VVVQDEIRQFVRSRIDMDKFNQIKQKYVGDEDLLTTVRPIKYFSDTYIFVKLKNIIALGLHKREPCNILDLGSGAGWFSLLCKFLGHTTYCLDAVPPISAEWYGEVIELFGLQRKLHTIRPFQHLPEMPMKFDVVVALQVCFNLYGGHFDWGVGEWSYLINDLQRCCNKNFLFYIEFNKHKKTDRHHGMFYSDIMRQWLSENNFKYDNRYALFQSTSKFPLQESMENYEKSREPLDANSRLFLNFGWEKV
jgi:hypothetical protein